MLTVDGDTQRLFIFFSGHGISKGTSDYWLLSDIRDDSSEAVNVANSVKDAYDCGIGHVAFFADACRTPPDRDLLKVEGRSIFPPWRIINDDVEIDQFYATRAGDPAWEGVGRGGAAPFGIFTRCLMRGLRGEEPGVVKAVVGGEEPQAVLAHSLRKVLQRTVRLTASHEAGVDMCPQCIACSNWEPNVLAWLPVPPLGDVPGAGPGDVPVPGLEQPEPQGVLDVASREYAALEAQDQAAVESLRDEYEAACERGSFETGKGLSVIGARVSQSFLGGKRRRAFQEHDVWHVTSGDDGAHAALLRLNKRSPEGLNWAGAAVFPGFSGVLKVGSVGVDYLAYLPTSSISQASLTRRETAQAVSLATAQVRIGLFDPDHLTEIVGTSLQEDLNPSLAVLAAHEWGNVGRFGRVRSLIDAFRRRGRAIPYDVALIAGIPPDDLDVPVIPGFPLLTRGWALADTLPAGHEIFLAARRALAPAIWTTFRHLPRIDARQLAAPIAVSASTTAGAETPIGTS